jgi:hypothetical protein
MDVVLDANAYLSDPRMEGNAFRSLLDYLRKTQSNLIVPKLVLDEVIGRYPDRLGPQIRRAISEISSLRNLLLAARLTKIPEINFEREKRALRSKIFRPSKYVRSIVLKDFSGISIAEVALRGVERIPPQARWANNCEMSSPG